MPYTREMFVKEYHPENYGDFLLGRQEGLQKGLEKGELIGNITTLEKILKCQVASKEALREKSIEELLNILESLDKQIN